jgi:hypothetical protein
MNDDQLRRLLRQVDEPVTPDPAYADRLFEQLTRTAARRQGMRPAVLLVAALTLIAALSVGAALAGRPWRR